MSIVALVLFLFALTVGGTIIYAGYRMFKSAHLADEETARKRAQQHAEKAAAISTKYPAKKVKDDLETLKKLLDRSL